ncbi:MAG: aconitate hydratase [Nitrospirota bacterium]
MGMTAAEKILSSHIVEGTLERGKEIGIKIDHVLTQDATGTMAYLEFEAMGINKIRAELAVSYVDHNLLQTDFKNADDHRFLQSAAARYGAFFSKAGGGISHQVHMEKFSVPGNTMLGSDSHTSTNGAMSMIAIGAGGLDVAMAMAGYPFYLTMPKILGVKLTGELSPWVSGKDVILEMLRRLTVKGGLGRIVEYFGPGVSSLSATDRGTIANMGAELGCTTSVFPSDENTRRYLESQGRGDSWVEIYADKDAIYDEVIEIDLNSVPSLIACPSSPDNVKKVSDVEGIMVNQVIIGSSVNSSFRDLMIVCEALKDRTISPWVSLEINPGSAQVLENVAQAGGILSLIHAGARIQQSGCLGCIGMGQAPPTGTVSLRTFPRNFSGRSGTKDDQIYLCSPETAVAAAITGKITDPKKLGEYPAISTPDKFIVNKEMIIEPPEDDSSQVEIIRGPNIKPFPEFPLLKDKIEGEVILKVGDNITTDHIMPAGNDVLPLRSNIEAISEFVYNRVDTSFAERAKEKGGGFIIGGENYGQGSSREHAALAPRYLGIQVKIVKSFARIHRSNLINFGIIPLLFKESDDYNSITDGDKIKIPDVKKLIEGGADEIPVYVNGNKIITLLNVTKRERDMLIYGGLMNYVKNR